METQYEYVHEKFRHLVTANNQERIWLIYLIIHTDIK